jgi:hypothetical protein
MADIGNHRSTSDTITVEAIGDEASRFVSQSTPELLRLAFDALKKHAAPGVDGTTWSDYEADLERRELHDRVHRGTYRPQPSRRVYIPKAPDPLQGRRRRNTRLLALPGPDFHRLDQIDLS